MKILTRAITLSATLMAAATITTQSASAVTIEQSQELSNTAKASVTCTGSCSGSAEATQNGKQSQKIELPSPVTEMHTGRVIRYNYSHGRVVHVPATVIMMADGQVRLSWGMRGGTCHVRYTEANQNVWKYNTSAGCDDGGVTIGALQSGTKYKFQVRQDNGDWSRAMSAIAQ